jgi:hypothetical protein
MNWFPMRAWWWLSDTTAYLTLFITISGLYLWYVLRAEAAHRLHFARDRNCSSFLHWHMSSPAENQSSSAATPETARDRASLLAVCERWNRKLHFYTGLFLLLFLWLFAFTGLLLNHPTWAFQESWLNRHETKYKVPIVPPGAGLTGRPRTSARPYAPNVH